jgi:phytoene dehydrogenase-like protein
MRASGVSPELVDRVLRPFFAGVFLEDRMDTSGRFFHLVWRAFLRGGAALPADGMRALPDQLAASLPAGTIHCGVRATAITGTGVRTEDGEVRGARVLVATDGSTAAGLLPGLTAPEWYGVTTFHHASAAPIDPEPMLLLDPDGRVLVNSAPVSAAAPGYAPAGRTLVASSVLGVPSDLTAMERRVRSRLTALYGTDDWDLVTVHPIPRALPAMPAPHPMRRPVRAGDRRYVCGDHRDTSSVQGALASGRRAARAILADAGLTPSPA